MQDTVIHEQGDFSWGAYVPDLPVCRGTGLGPMIRRCPAIRE